MSVEYDIASIEDTILERLIAKLMNLQLYGTVQKRETYVKEWQWESLKQFLELVVQLQCCLVFMKILLYQLVT